MVEHVVQRPSVSTSVSPSLVSPLFNQLFILNASCLHLTSTAPLPPLLLLCIAVSVSAIIRTLSLFLCVCVRAWPRALAPPPSSWTGTEMDGVCSPHTSCLFSPSVSFVLPSHFSPPFLFQAIFHFLFLCFSFLYILSAPPPSLLFPDNPDPFPLLVCALAAFISSTFQPVLLRQYHQESSLTALYLCSQPPWTEAQQHFNAD